MKAIGLFIVLLPASSMGAWTFTPTASPTVSATWSPTRTVTKTSTPTFTTTFSMSPTYTSTPTATRTFTATPTSTLTPVIISGTPIPVYCVDGTGATCTPIAALPVSVVGQSQPVTVRQFVPVTVVGGGPLTVAQGTAGSSNWPVTLPYTQAISGTVTSNQGTAGAANWPVTLPYTQVVSASGNFPVTAAATFPVSMAGSSVTQMVRGSATEAATVPANPLYMAGKTGNSGTLKGLIVDGNGILQLGSLGSGDAKAVSIIFPTANNGAASSGFATAPYGFDGTSYQRQRGDTNGTWVEGSVTTGGAFPANPLAMGDRDSAGKIRPVFAHQDTTGLASSSRTASAGTADFTMYNLGRLEIFLDVTAQTSGSVTVVAYNKDPVSGKYFSVFTSAAVSTTGSTRFDLGPGITAGTTAANAVLSNTMAVSCLASSPMTMTYSLGLSQAP